MNMKMEKNNFVEGKQTVLDLRTYGMGMLQPGDGSESATICLCSEIGKCWHLKMDEKPLTAVDLWVRNRGYEYGASPKVK